MLKANCILYRLSKKRLCFLNKKGLSSNLIDSNLVEYSTSQLKTHIRKKHHITPVGHSETVLRRFEDWLTPLLSHEPRRGALRAQQQRSRLQGPRQQPGHGAGGANISFAGISNCLISS